MEDGIRDDRHLTVLVESQLAKRRPWRLGFPRELEMRFEADEGPRRSRAVLWAGLLGLFIYNSFLLNDFFERREIFLVTLGWRLGGSAICAAALVAIARRWLNPAWRETMIATALVVVMYCACRIFRLTPSDIRTFDPFVFSLVFLAGNISLRMRFVHAASASAITLGMALYFVVTDDRLPHQAQVFAMILMSGTALFTVEAAYSMERGARLSYLLRLREILASRAAERRAEGYARLSHTDALTGLPNRRAFDQALATRWDDGPASLRCWALIAIDVDNFKAYNDLYGHPAGDACLQQVSQAMRQVLPPDAFLARLGGEEFVGVVEAPTAADCSHGAEQVRAAVERLHLSHDATTVGVVTISVGVAIRPPGSPADFDTIISLADRALYRSKRGGRNRCTHTMVDATDLAAVEKPAQPRPASDSRGPASPPSAAPRSDMPRTAA